MPKWFNWIRSFFSSKKCFIKRKFLLDETQYCQAATVVTSLAAVELLYNDKVLILVDLFSLSLFFSHLLSLFFLFFSFLSPSLYVIYLFFFLSFCLSFLYLSGKKSCMSTSYPCTRICLCICPYISIGMYYTTLWG